MRVLAPLLKVCLAGLLVLLAAEIFTRAFLASPSRSVHHPLLGSVWQAHKPMLHATEGFTRFTINNVGLNDADVSATLPQATRVIVLGDSYTEAQQVPRHQNFVEVADAALGNKVALLNAGRSGIQPLTTLPLLETYAPHFAPHKVVLVMNHSDYPELKASNGAIVHRDESGDITHISRPTESADGLRWKLQPLMHSSALLTHSLKRAKKIFQKLKKEAKQRLGIKEIVQRKKNDLLFYETVGPQSMQEQGAYLPLATFTLQELAAKYPLEIIYIPAFDYAPQGQAAQSDDDIAIAHFFATAAFQAGVPFHSLSAEFAAAYAASGQPLAGFHHANGRTSGHLNHDGHAVVAKKLTQILSNAH